MPTVDDDLMDLEKKIRQLKIEYEIFFIGERKTPPTNIRNGVENTIQRLLEDKRMSFAQKFKFNTLVARYSSFRELWRKKQQDKEERGVLRDRQELQELIEHQLSHHRPAPRSFTFISRDPVKQEEQARNFYEFLRESYERTGNQPFNMDFPKFINFLRIKTSDIQQKFRCREVEFQANIDEREHKVNLKAKPRSG